MEVNSMLKLIPLPSITFLPDLFQTNSSTASTIKGESAYLYQEIEPTSISLCSTVSLEKIEETTLKAKRKYIGYINSREEFAKALSSDIHFSYCVNNLREQKKKGLPKLHSS